MANTLTASPPKRSTTRWFPALGLALLMLALLAMVAGVWWMNESRLQASARIETDLLRFAEPTKVHPHLALLMLADYPAEQVWQEPLRQQQGDGALAMWLFGPVRSDRVSIDNLLTLAEMQKLSNADASAALLLTAADVVRLSPELSDRERADLLVAIGRSLHGLGLTQAAVTEWRQASILAHYGPSMPALYRATLLHDLAVLYKQVGARRLEARAREASAQVGTASGALAIPERILLDTEDLPPEPPALQAAREQRRNAAQEAARLLGSPTEQLAYSILREALSAEGLQHRTWIAAELQAGHPREVQAALLLFHINWLQRERMLAWNYGGDEFPTWSKRRGQIEAALHEAWDALEIVRMDQSIREGVQERATLAQRDWWATRLIQARLLRDPALDVPGVTASMLPNNADPAGDALLRLDWSQERFWRIPREYVGTNRLPE